MKKLPLNIQTFKDIIKQDFLYVDKTKEIYQLVHTPSVRYFLSRPRRFGKSLLISTLQEIMEGNKELFKGFWIYDKIHWKKHIVVRIDFSKLTYTDGQTLEQDIILAIEKIAKEHGIELSEENMKSKWEELIKSLYKTSRNQVVLLIDEYDAPINNSIDKPHIIDGIQDVLRQFYQITKAIDTYWRMVFITGITKYAKLSLFSAMNNLTDISVDDTFSQVVGFSKADLKVYFEGYLTVLQDKLRTDGETLMRHIQYWYNGYSWDGENKLYNPYSILSLFQKMEFRNYWFSSGTPTLLIQQIKKIEHSLAGYESKPLTLDIFESFEVENMPVDSLLWQTGYLSIQSREFIDIGYTIYNLAYPNHEVRTSFIKHILAHYTRYNIGRIEPDARLLKEYLLRDNIDAFIELLQQFIGRIPSKLHIEQEYYYHSLFYMILRLVGVDLQLEKRGYKGDVDGVLEFPNKVYIIEVKYTKDARRTMKSLTNAAIQQIKQKDYPRPYIGEIPQRKIYLLGIGVLEKKIGYQVEKV